MGVALVVTIGAIAALIKRYETRLVLLSAGILMALLSLEPMTAFKQFDKSMTNATLIIAICSAMGFASVVSLTKCDVHLVALLTKPLKKLGLIARLHARRVTDFDCHPFDLGTGSFGRSDDHSAHDSCGFPSGYRCRERGGVDYARLSQPGRIAQCLRR